MKKNKLNKSVGIKKNHIKVKVDEKVDELEEVLFATKKTLNNMQAIRPTSVDVTHRFGKRSGST